MTLPAGPGDQDTAEEGLATPDPEAAWEVGAGMEPDDAAEGAAILEEAAEAGELRPES